MKPEEMAHAAADETETQAAQLDALISARQHGHPVTTPHPEAELVDRLLTLAATTAPTDEFLARLEQQLQRQFSQHEQAQPQQLRTAPWHPFRSLRAWLWQRGRLAFAFATLLLCFTLFTAPVVRATLWDWLYGFGLVEEATLAGRTLPIETPVQPANAPAPLTLATIQQQAPFPFQPPTVLPAGLRFTGGFVMPTATETSVTLAYHTTDEPAGGYALAAPLLFVAISDGAIPNRPVVAAEHQQAVRLGQNIGIYTHGNWQSTTPSAAADQTGPLFWDSTTDAAWLTWQADGLNYLLYAQGLGFTTTEMAQIAESME